jgi:Secretion system C-terminal sorting domain
MRKFYFLATALFASIGAMAQCTVTLSYTINGNTVTAGVVGNGAVNPAYAIEWGDGTQDLTQSGTHTYADGIYSICGAMYDSTNPLGCAVLDCYDITIGQGGGSDCTVSFTPIISGLNVAVNATGNGATEPVYSITWGDGTPEEMTATSYHTYAMEGEYTICVLYADNTKGGCIVENCQTITVSELQTDCTVVIDVTSDPETGVTSVIATGTGAENPQYVIAWGDGSLPAVGSTGTYTYANSGTYDLCITYVDINSPLACNVTGCSTVDIALAIDESANWNPSLIVYPNPANEVLNVQWAGASTKALHLQLLDMSGRIIDHQYIGNVGLEMRQWSIDLSNVAAGSYVVKMNSEKGERSVRFIK